MRRLALLIAALVLGLAGGSLSAATVYKVGDEIPGDTALSVYDGKDVKDVKLSTYEGSAVLLFFYRTTTRHAADEAKQADAIRKGREKQKLVVVGVARDAKPEEARKFGEDNKLGFTQAGDPKSELYDKFAAKGLPYVAILDGKRKLRYSAAGIDDEAVETALTDVLGAKDPPPDTGGKKK
jgi:peroxiredoxin